MSPGRRAKKVTKKTTEIAQEATQEIANHAPSATSVGMLSGPELSELRLKIWRLVHAQFVAAVNACKQASEILVPMAQAADAEFARRRADATATKAEAAAPRKKRGRPRKVL